MLLLTKKRLQMCPLILLEKGIFWMLFQTCLVGLTTSVRIDFLFWGKILYILPCCWKYFLPRQCVWRPQFPQQLEEVWVSIFYFSSTWHGTESMWFKPWLIFIHPLEVTIRHWKGHFFTTPRRSPSQNCQDFPWFSKCQLLGGGFNDVFVFPPRNLRKGSNLTFAYFSIGWWKTHQPRRGC